MSSYPMTFQTVEYHHKGGTKRYFTTVVTTPEGSSLVVYRWGPMNAWGQIKVERFSSAVAAQKASESKLREKRSGGYSQARLEVVQRALSEHEVEACFGKFLFAKIGSDNLKFLDPDMKVPDMKGSTPLYDEDGKEFARVESEEWKIARAKALQEARQKEEEEKRRLEEEARRLRAQEQEEAQRMKSLPTYGLF